MGKIIGIDLGTTNSCVAVLEGGTARVKAGDREEVATVKPGRLWQLRLAR